MNFCTKCGAKIAPGSKFCSKCGTPLADSVNQPPSSTNASNPDNDSLKRATQNSTPVGAETKDGAEAFYPEMIDFSKKKNKAQKKRTQKKRISKKKFFGILIPVLLLLIVGVVFYLKYKTVHPTIDVSPYLEIQFEGYDGDGQVKDYYPCLNMEKLQRKITKTGIENVYVSAQDFGDIQLLKDGKPTDGKNLHEGDVLTIKLDCDPKDLFEKTGIQFIGTTKEVKVSLNSLVEVDVFEDFTPQITGMSPAGHLRTDLSLYGDSTNSFVSGCYKEYGTLPFDFYLNNKQVTDDTWLAVDDVLEVRLNDTGTAYLKDQGLEAGQDKEKKTITATLAMFEHGAWVTDPEEIDSETEQNLASRMQGSAESYAAKCGYTDNVQFVGMAYCSLKDGINLDESTPAQYFVYEVKEKNVQENAGDEFDYIFVSHEAIYEQVENYGAEDAVENPGEIKQYFNGDEDSFDCEYFSNVEDLKARFTEWNNRVDYTMDSALKTLLNWTN